MSNTDKSLVVGLLLVDPETHERLEVTSPLKINKDASFSFACLNAKTRTMWKHTIKTEEITLSEMRKLTERDAETDRHWSSADCRQWNEEDSPTEDRSCWWGVGAALLQASFAIRNIIFNDDGCDNYC